MSQTAAAQTEQNPTTIHQGDLGGKYVVFFLGDEEFGVPILSVREIIAMAPITHLPQAPAYVRGVINLRGTVVPVLDLRLKFGMSLAEDSRESCILVVRTDGKEMGVAVDRMSEVTNVSRDEIQPPPSIGHGVDTSHILGIDKSAGKVRLLLDIDRIVLSGELMDLQGIIPEDAPAH